MALIDSITYEPCDPVELIPNLLIADVVMLVGKKGAAKSQTVAHWAACVTDGKEFVPGVISCVRGHAVIFSGERSVERTWIPRLIAAGVSDYRNTVYFPRVDNLERAACMLVELIAKDPKIKIVFIDPVNAFLDGGSPNNAKTRQLSKPFFEICERNGICAVFVHHVTKAGHKDLIDIIGGSGGWSQAAGSIWAVAKIKDSAILQRKRCPGHT